MCRQKPLSLRIKLTSQKPQPRAGGNADNGVDDDLGWWNCWGRLGMIQRPSVPVKPPRCCESALQPPLTTLLCPTIGLIPLIHRSFSEPRRDESEQQCRDLRAERSGCLQKKSKQPFRPFFSPITTGNIARRYQQNFKKKETMEVALPAPRIPTQGWDV